MNTADADLAAAIGRVRRMMPRNLDVMAICDAAERLQDELRAARHVVTTPAPLPDVVATLAAMKAADVVTTQWKAGGEGGGSEAFP